MNKIVERLRGIDVGKRMDEIKEELKETGSARQKDKLVKELKILRNLKENDLTPEEAFTRTKVPVIPSQYRAPMELGNGVIVNPDVNTLYRDLGFAVNAYKKAKETLPEERLAKARRALYNTLRDVQGIHNPANEKVEKNLWSEMAGKGPPKGGFFQSKVTRKRQDLTGRSVITPNPELDIDEVEIPYDMAFDLYEPFVKQELIARGYKRKEIDSLIKNKDAEAKDALERAGKERPVFINRAPSVFNTAVTAHKPIFTDEKNIAIPNLVAPFLEGDFDGDQVGVHVPISAEAVREAEELLPSKNTIREGTKDLAGIPDHEAITGLFVLSQTSEGRKEINNILPKKYQIRSEMNKGKLKSILFDISKDDSIKHKGKIFNDLRKLGNQKSYKDGFSIGLSDVFPLKDIREKYLKEIKHKLRNLPKDKNYKKNLTNVYKDIIDQSTKEIKRFYKKNSDNPFGIMLNSGSRGSASQYRDAVLSPFAVEGDYTEDPIEHSYIEGLTPAESFEASIGARRGVLARAQGTRDPGALGKELLATENTVVVGPERGEFMNTIDLSLDNEDDVLDRFLGKTVRDRNGHVIAKKNSLVNPEIIQRSKKAGLNNLPVYTPLGSTQPGGYIPGMAYGIDTHTGKVAEPGKNIGAISSLGVVGPLFTGSMQAFHTGGSLDAEDRGFPRLKQLFEMTNTLPGEATLAKKDGRVEKIRKDSLGGHEVFVDGKKHYVLPSNEVKIKVGDTVKQGDIISGGPVKIQDYAKIKGLRDAQNYMVEEIRKNVPSMRRRAIETVVEGITRHGKVVDPGDTEFDYGDVALINEIEEKNKEAKNKAIYEPLGKGVNMLPQNTQDWLSKFNYRHLKRQFKEEIGKGGRTNIHSYAPIPGLAFGKEFGKGEEGKY